MNRAIIATFLAFLLVTQVWGQQLEPIEVTEFKVEKCFDEIQGRISIDIKIPESVIGDNFIDPAGITKLSESEKWPVIAIKNAETDGFIYVFWGSDVQAQLRGISFVISDAKQDLVQKLNADQKEHYVFISADLIIPLTNGALLKITPLVMKQKTADTVYLPEKEAEMLVKARGGEMYMYSNKIDFGVESRDSDDGDSKNEYVLSFTYSQRLEPEFLDWNTVAVKGRISSDSESPLSRLQIYPINVNFYSTLRPPMQVVGQAGFEGNQKFTNGRISADFYLQGIIPNFVNWTRGENRLRLKPVLKIGVKGFQEFDNTRDESENQLSGETYAEFYYYVPILEHYSLLLEANAFYVFSDEVAPDQKIRWNYDATLGIKIPGTDFKVIAKYSFGENDVNFVRDDELLLGFVVDVFDIPGQLPF